MTKIKLFSAVQISRSIANKANLEARYYEYLKKADTQFAKPNNALLSIVNALNRLVKSAERLGKSPQQAFADGYFDCTIDEYKRLTAGKSFESAKEKLMQEKKSVVDSLSLLGKPMDKIEAYFENKWKFDILPMQAFELTMSKSGFISDIVFGSEFHNEAFKEYNISKAVKSVNSAIKLLTNDEKTEKEKTIARQKIDDARKIFDAYNISMKVIEGKVMLIDKSLPKPKVKAKKESVPVL